MRIASERGAGRRRGHPPTIALVLPLLDLLGTVPASAGPPLISDDPGTIGPGRVEYITAVQSGGQRDVDLIEGPVADLTVGLFDGLDFVLTASPAFVLESTDPTRTATNVASGVKWRPVKTDHWVAAVTPVIGLNVLSGENVFFSLPVQIEYRNGRAAVGVDAGYAFIRKDVDAWRTSVYATWQATPSLLLEAELWGNNSPGLDGEYGTGIGMDWTFRPGVALLAMAGTGITSEDGNRVEWVGYLGVRLAFPLWQPGPGHP
jgi:hypothetical protein